MEAIDPLFSRTPVEVNFLGEASAQTAEPSRCPFYMDCLLLRARSSLRPHATLLKPDAGVSKPWRVDGRRTEAHNPNNALVRWNNRIALVSLRGTIGAECAIPNSADHPSPSLNQTAIFY